MSSAKSGGGITSRVNKNVSIRPEQRRTEVINPAQTDYLGQATAFGKGPFVERKAQAATPMGNDIAQATVCGPGGSRNIYARGVQGCHGNTTGTVRQGRDILSDFGPEKSRG